MSVNKVILIGRLTQDPQLKYTPAGKAVCSFSVATSSTWNDEKGDKHEKVEYHKIVCWGKLAEISNQYLAKGRQVYIEGSLQTRSWDDKKTGEKRYTTEVLAQMTQMLGSKAKEDVATLKDPNEPEVDDEPTVDFTSDDIPF